MDIGSANRYPSGALSNFAPHPFTFRGEPCNSMEGLLQSFKFDNPDMAAHVRTLVGIAAKRKGSKRNKRWRTAQTLWWNGEPIDRHGPEYQQLLDEAFEAMFTQNNSARRALLASGDATLTHSIGSRNARDTVLTIREFCGRLTRIREQLRDGTLHPQ